MCSPDQLRHHEGIWPTEHRRPLSRHLRTLTQLDQSCSLVRAGCLNSAAVESLSDAASPSCTALSTAEVLLELHSSAACGDQMPLAEALHSNVHRCLEVLHALCSSQQQLPGTTTETEGDDHVPAGYLVTHVTWPTWKNGHEQHHSGTIQSLPASGLPCQIAGLLHDHWLNSY